MTDLVSQLKKGVARTPELLKGEVKGGSVLLCSRDFRGAQARESRSSAAASDDFVFTNQSGKPLDQEWLNDRVWKPTLRSAGIAERGQYCIRDTFICLALSSRRHSQKS